MIAVAIPKARDRNDGVFGKNKNSKIEKIEKNRKIQRANKQSIMFYPVFDKNSNYL